MSISFLSVYTFAHRYALCISLSPSLLLTLSTIDSSHPSLPVVVSCHPIPSLIGIAIDDVDEGRVEEDEKRADALLNALT